MKPSTCLAKATIGALVTASLAVVQPLRADLIISDTAADQVRRIDSTNGTLLGTFTGATLANPQGLVVRNGKLLVADQDGRRVVQYDLGTSLFESVLIPSNYLFGATGMTAPTGMTLGPDGQLYITDASRVVRWDFSASTGSVFTTGEAPSSGRGLTFGPDTNLYVAVASGNRVKRYNGTTGAFINDWAANFITSPWDLVFRKNVNGSGDLDLIVSGLRAASSATNLVFQGPFDASPGTFISGFTTGTQAPLPTGIGFGLSDHFFVADNTTGGNILEYDANGNYLGIFWDGPSNTKLSFLTFTDNFAIPEPSAAIFVFLGWLLVRRKTRV